MRIQPLTVLLLLCTGLFLVCTQLAFAQDPGVPSPDEIPVYLPGGDEAGPTLPSQRGLSPIFSQNRLLRLSPYVGVSGLYDTALAPIATDADGNLGNLNRVGMMLNFGVVGSRPYRKSLLNVAYQGNVLHYPNASSLSMSSHMGQIDFSRSVSRKLTLRSINGGSIFNNAFMGAFAFPQATLGLSPNPDTEIFNTPVYGLFTQQQLTYQKSVRFGVTLGGGGFSQFRRSSALASVYGPLATGTAYYRLSARTTVAGTYMFSQYFFGNSYGSMNFHMASVELAHKLSARTEVGVSLGGVRTETQSLRSVPLDPLLAALIGRSTGVEAFYDLNYLPTFALRASRSMRDWTLSARGSRAMNPGNGLVLGGMATMVDGGVTYSGLRNVTLNASGQYSEMNAILGNIRGFRSQGASIGVTVKLGRGLDWTTGVLARKFLVSDQSFSNPFLDRVQYRVMTGLRWTPSPVQLPFF